MKTWRIARLLVLALAMFLSVSVAVPASAADPGKPIPPKGPSYKQYWDYKDAWNNEMLETSRNENPSPKIHPSGPATGRTESKSTKGKVLVGRIMGPGEKISIIPDIMEPKPGAGTGLSKLVGPFSGILRFGLLGIGSKAIPPENAVDVYRSQGVSETCIATASTCTGDELKKQVQINSCSISNTCHTYSTPATETPLQVQPLPADMWSILTNQSDQEVPPAPTSHYDWTSAEGCTYTPTVVNFDGSGMAGADFEIKLNAARPTNTTTRQYYDSRCATGTDLARSPSGYSVVATCVDAAGNGLGLDGVSFSRTIPGSSFFPQGTIVAACINTTRALKPPVSLVSLTFVQTTPSQGTLEKYSNGVYKHWVNPNPAVNTIAETEITTAFECLDSVGAVYSYTISQKGAASWPTPNCPEGTTLKKFDVSSKTAGGTNRALGGANVVNGALDTYGDCMTSGCALEVYVDGQKCVVGRADCETWSQIRAKQPSRVVCKWGSHIVASSNCLTLAEGFKSERGTIYDPNSDTIVSVDEDGQTSTEVNPTPWNPLNPDPTPGVITTPNTNIDTGSGTGTGTGTGGFPTTGTNPQVEGNNCIAAAWSWNPVDWVMVPVQCALQWAFAPDPVKTQQHVANLKTRLETRGIGPIVTTLTSSFSAAGDSASGSGCQGPPVYFPPLDKTYYFFDACSAPMSQVALISRAVVGFSVVGLGGFTAVRIIASAFGMNFTMGRSGSGDS